MKAWTDYPLTRDACILGPVLDEPYTEAPIREVEVLGWDGNKYARVRFEDGVYVFKAGYLYTEPFRLTMDADTIPQINVSQLPVLGGIYSKE
jgi:hypothetical protein